MTEQDDTKNSIQPVPSGLAVILMPAFSSHLIDMGGDNPKLAGVAFSMPSGSPVLFALPEAQLDLLIQFLRKTQVDLKLAKAPIGIAS